MSEVIDAPPSLENLAERLDCIPEAGLLRLADITPSTAETWRRRHTGPAYVLVGNRVLYPRTAVVEWLTTQLRERKGVAAKGLL